MQEQLYCQSCGMPMTKQEEFGTNEDNSPNQEYCCYCYQKGKFTSDCTMEEMIQFNLGVKEMIDAFGSKEAAEKQMREFFPKLKRWAKKEN